MMRKQGERLLSLIHILMEQALIGVMFDIPRDDTISKVVVTKETVEGGSPVVEHGVPRVRYQVAAEHRTVSYTHLRDAALGPSGLRRHQTVSHPRVRKGDAGAHHTAVQPRVCGLRRK